MGTRARRRTWGADIIEDGVDFRVWAPKRKKVTLVVESPRPQEIAMHLERGGVFSAFARGTGAGARYRFRLDDDEKLYPDPASRSQPEGPHGPSEVVDPTLHVWRDQRHPGVELAGQVIYEMHVGTFTPEGTWASAAAQLPALRDIGITLIEMMPIAEFPGKFGWGYDGVNLYAPSHLYGTPDDLRAFVDAAHALGMGVILDVVYNHFGPDGNYLAQFSDDLFSKDKKTDWGIAIDFSSEAVRSFFIDNARYWIDEMHFDGLRLDATQDIHDDSPRPIIAELVAEARKAAAPRAIVVVAENEPQHADYVRPVARGGYGVDALWNDDYHHAAIAAATGRCEAYYSDTPGTPQELISALRWGYLFQGQRYAWQKNPRGRPALDLDAPHFVVFLQNHDQVANSARGQRLHALTTPGRARALKALTLLAPGTPMLFQGEEHDASTPFHYFADHAGELGRMVRDGRKEFLAQFPSLREVTVPDPSDPATFAASTLDPREREAHHEARVLTRDLLALRKNDPVFSRQRADRMHGAVLGAEAFLLRHIGDRGDDRLLLVNLGRDLVLTAAPEPLIAPPRGRRWKVILSTEDSSYGGLGTPALDPDAQPRLHGHSTLVLTAEEL